MSLRQNLLATLIISLAWNAGSYGQTAIELDTQAIQRLGIISVEVKTIDNSAGAKFPATVMNSPLASSKVVSVYSGVLKSWLVKPGSTVDKGDILAEINSPALLNLQDQWQNNEYERQQLEFELKKDETLLNEGIISKQRFMQTQRNYQQILSSTKMLAEKLALAGMTESDLQNLLIGNIESGMYVLRSAASGVLSHLAVSAGDYIEVNITLASINSPRVWLTAQVPARIGTVMSAGQTLRVEGNNAELILRQKDFEIDQLTQSIGIQAEFSNEVNLLPGQMVLLIVPPINAGVLIPSDAVVHSGDETTVYIQNANGFEARPVSLKPAGSDYLAEAGVAPGERIVIRGSAVLKGIQLGLGGE